METKKSKCNINKTPRHHQYPSSNNEQLRYLQEQGQLLDDPSITFTGNRLLLRVMLRQDGSPSIQEGCKYQAPWHRVGLRLLGMDTQGE